MARRFILVAIAAALAVVWPASSYAATAPAAAPVLTSAPYALPATFTWTPAADPLDTSETVMRANGVCASPVTGGGPIQAFPGNTQASFSANPVDGTYCYWIQAGDVLLGTANSPGLTVVVDTHNPTATLAVAPLVGKVVTGVVNVSGTSADAVSGVDSASFHVGATGACPTGVVIGPTWDTTTVANGNYDVCNVVTDKAGHEQITVLPVTVANPVASPVPTPAPVTTPTATAPATPPPTIVSSTDKAAPKAPSKVTFTLPRSKTASTGSVAVTLHWVNPKASDFDRTVVILNLKHAPRTPADGSKIYAGIGTSAVVKLAAGGTGYVALFAYDHSKNISSPAQKLVSLAPLIPLRPFTGSTVTVSPRLSWTARKGTAYYNVQLFHNGTRVLTGWPSQAAFSIPAGKLQAGTYVWFVWPAVRHGSATPTFGKLIGRATFVYKGI